MPRIVTCKECGEEKPHGAFGLCRRCYNRRYYERNRGACHARANAYYERNREAILTRTKAYYERNRAVRSAYQKAYRGRDREGAGNVAPVSNR